MTYKKVPEGTISRLFLYLRELSDLERFRIRTVSSLELAERLNLSDAQVRKDLGYFGQFGVSGSGYDISTLKTSLEEILGKDRSWNIAVIGVGHLGEALLNYPGFSRHRLNIAAAFDINPTKIGKQIAGIQIYAIGELSRVIKSKKIHIGVITVPADSAQEVADKLIESGVECILNFTPRLINVPEGVKIKNVDLSRELETLTYYLANK